MKQQIIQIIESHRPPMIHPTNRSGGEYAVACEVDRILDEVISDVEKLEEKGDLTEGIFKVYNNNYYFIDKNKRIYKVNGEGKYVLEYQLIDMPDMSDTFIPCDLDFKCPECNNTLVRNRSRGTLYCGICKK